MPSRRGTTWTVDEYVVVGELWQRRGRSVGVNDPDVKELAALLGRSPGSISYRVGNFSGTDRAGTGLKPIVGEPLEFWERIRDNPAAVKEAARNAWARLTLLNTEGEAPPTGSSPKPGARIVDPRRPSTKPVRVVSEAQARMAKQEEAELREQYRSWVDPDGDRLRGIDIITPALTKLEVDLFDPEVNVLIEAKARAERDYLRFAIGQLYDYQRYLEFAVNLAVLVPQRPSDDLLGLLDSAGVGCIWPVGDGFTTRSKEMHEDPLRSDE